ncbi:MAG: glycosyltransferase family 2 protein [bacterium]
MDKEAVSREDIALVVIGRNEARHLEVSLPSIRGQFSTMVYVDSGSSDGSQAIATQHGAHVVALDTSAGFTAARARNAGFEEVLRLAPNCRYVQFIDGDCELLESFVAKAAAWLDKHDDTAMVCGRRLERYPEASVYNMLCDIEWDTPVGKAKYCGGDAMVRVEALQQVGAYNPSLIAGEEPEMCVRLAKEGWGVYRLDADMTLHDANMTKFPQWWKRNLRAGYAFAEGAAMHGAAPVFHWAREVKSNWAWGGLFALILSLSLAVSPWFLLGLGLYILLGLKVMRGYPWPRNRTFRERFSYGLNCSIGKIPQSIGQLKFLFNRLFGKSGSIIEYK